MSSPHIGPKSHGSCTWQRCPTRQSTCPPAETFSLRRGVWGKGGSGFPPRASRPSDYHSALDAAMVPSTARRSPPTSSSTTSTARCHTGVYKGTRSPPSPLCITPPYNDPIGMGDLRHRRDDDCLRERRSRKSRDESLLDRNDKEDGPKLQLKLEEFLRVLQRLLPRAPRCVPHRHRPIYILR